MGEFVALALALALAGCEKKEEVKCEDLKPATQQPKPKKSLEPLSMLAAGNRDPSSDWCRTCVMGPKGWASCQTVYAENKEESRDAIKVRSREKACDDAGFAKGQCPDKAVLGVTCKGDKAPAGNDRAVKGMQAVFFKGNDVTKELTDKAAAEQEQKDKKSDAPKSQEPKN